MAIKASTYTRHLPYFFRIGQIHFLCKKHWVSSLIIIPIAFSQMEICHAKLPSMVFIGGWLALRLWILKHRLFFPFMTRNLSTIVNVRVQRMIIDPPSSLSLSQVWTCLLCISGSRRKPSRISIQVPHCIEGKKHPRPCATPSSTPDLLLCQPQYWQDSQWGTPDHFFPV